MPPFRTNCDRMTKCDLAGTGRWCSLHAWFPNSISLTRLLHGSILACCILLHCSVCISDDGIVDVSPSDLPPLTIRPQIAAILDLEEDEVRDALSEEGEGDFGGAGDDADEMIEQIVQELFRGTVVYPQEKGEWQITSGYSHGSKVRDDGIIPIEVEYGITDRLQLGIEAPVNLFSSVSDNIEGVEHLGIEIYSNFYSNAATGTALGLGYGIGIPTQKAKGDPNSYVHETTFVAYQEIGQTAVNFSGVVEVEDSSVETNVEGELALGVFRELGAFVPMLEWSIEIEEDEIPTVLAPGLFWKSGQGFEVGASLPIGLNDDAPDIGAGLLFIYEFGGLDD